MKSDHRTHTDTHTHKQEEKVECGDFSTVPKIRRIWKVEILWQRKVGTAPQSRHAPRRQERRRRAYN